VVEEELMGQRVGGTRVLSEKGGTVTCGCRRKHGGCGEEKEVRARLGVYMWGRQKRWLETTGTGKQKNEVRKWEVIKVCWGGFEERGGYGWQGVKPGGEPHVWWGVKSGWRGVGVRKDIK